MQKFRCCFGSAAAIRSLAAAAGRTETEQPKLSAPHRQLAATAGLVTVPGSTFAKAST